MSIRAIVKELGGTNRVSQEMKVGPSAVSNWIADDAIPKARQIEFYALCLARGVDWRPPGLPAPAEAA